MPLNEMSISVDYASGSKKRMDKGELYYGVHCCTYKE